MLARWASFIASILVGVAVGLLVGWYILPVQYKDTTPGTLRIDFRSDYVLMVAEIYDQDKDFAQAVRRLVFLETALPGEVVQDAILFAEPRYADADLALLRSLYLVLQTGVQPVEQPAVDSQLEIEASPTPEEYPYPEPAEGGNP